MSIFRQIKSLLGKTEVETEADAPVAVVPAEVIHPAEAVERRTRKRQHTFKGLRVLIVDDSPTVVGALKKMLRSAGCFTLEAFDAEKGLELVRNEKPDLVFLDIVLPGMNGFAALRLMRREPLTQQIPVIMISGNEQATEQFYAKRIGADDFMKKPFSRFEVFARIEKLVDINKVSCHEASGSVEKPGVTPSTTSPSIQPETLSDPIVTPTLVMSSLDARKQLAAMGLQYFNQEQFVEAIKRWDKLALEFFIVGGGVNVNIQIGDKTLLELAKNKAQDDIVALLRNNFSLIQA